MSHINSYTDQWFSVWQRHLDEIPNSVALTDSNENLTFAQVEELSGKVYSRLLSIDAESGSTVLVRTSRGVRDIVAMMGILKRGFAYVLVEPTMPPERIEYIRLDSSAVCVIDDSLYEDIIANETYKLGYDRVDDHTPAYLVYTSGTTGTPKGVIHERGNLLHSCKSMEYDGVNAANRNTCFSLLCPLNFVVTTLVVNMFFYSGAHLFIPPIAILKNKHALISHLSDNHIDTAFLPPVVVRLFGQELPETLTTIYTGSDVVGGIYLPGRKLYNLYVMSETGFVICKHLIDKLEPLCPIGRPNPDIEVKLSEEGEILCRAPWLRGYVGGQGRDRDGYLMTGDLAKLDADGNFVLVGRKDDMVKVNGNRVEPAEIEAVAKELSGLECAVRGVEGDGMSLALYYVSDKEIDVNNLVGKMRQVLPDYMIPSHFVRLDSLPRTAIGKLDRKRLPAPKTALVEYVDPQTDFEKRFCKVVADELGLEKVGLNDDFFSIGGSSINILNIISKLELKGFDAEHIYRARKIGDIISVYLESTQKSTLTEEEKEMQGRRSLQNFDDISVTPIDMIEDQLVSGNIVLNLPQILQLPWYVDMKRLCRAINTYISSSSTFQTDITRDSDGRVCYRYHPELVKEVVVERMSVAEAKEVIRTFVRPFRLIDELPYRIRLICAGFHKYLLFDIHHAFTDAEGLVHIGEDIFKLFCGQKPGSNNFFAWIADEKSAHTKAELRENLAFLKKYFDSTEWGVMLERGTGENCYMKYTVNTGVRLKDLNCCLAEHGWSRSSLLYASYILAAAKLTQSNDVLTSFLYGRRAGFENHAGVRFCFMCLGIHLSGIETADELVRAVEQDVIRAMSHMFPKYYEAFKNSTPWYLDDLVDIANVKELFGRGIKSIDPIYEPQYANGDKPTQQNVIRFFNNKGYLCICPDYNTFYVNNDDMKLLCYNMIDALKRLISGDGDVVRDYISQKE
ncbi:MAG: non-ribosomal peptide synthetase [Bacteroidales bacterium]|nr:non-ribosomal peptide synthetase [Candidatus Colimorpha onthohippi]